MLTQTVPHSYEQRKPETTLMHQIIREHLNTFVEEMFHEERTMPQYILKTIDRYLECGIPAHGVIKMACESCGTSFALPFSCKCRGICPSCHARRAAELAAHMVDNVIPHNPVRQYVVNLPFPLRFWMATHKHILARVCNIICSIIQEFILFRTSHQTREKRETRIKTGLVCFVQRFGSSLNLNPHFHIIAMDGVFYGDEQYRPLFVQMPKPTDDAIGLLAKEICETVNSYLIDEGFLVEEDGNVMVANTEDILNPDVDTDVHLPAMASSISQTIAFGPRKGLPVQRLRPNAGSCRSWPNSFSPKTTSPLCCSYDGYTVHAERSILHNDRNALEKLISYAARGPLSDDRLRAMPDGNVEVKLKTAWSNGTTHLIFSPSEFIEKLIALIPPPWFHMVRPFGLFVSNAKYRKEILPGEKSDADDKKPPQKKKKKCSIKWADLLKRVFHIDVTRCQKCGGLLKLTDILMPGPNLTSLLDELNLATAPPQKLPAKTAPIFGYQVFEPFCDEDFTPSLCEGSF